MIDLVFQIGLFVDYIPTWFGPALSSLGVGIIAFRTAIPVFSDEANPFPPLVMGLMMLFSGISVFQTNATLLSGILVVLGEWIKGLGTLRFWQKVVYGLKRRTIPTTKGSRVLYYSGIAFVLILAGWALVLIVITTNQSETLIYRIAVLWTVLTSILALLGFWWRTQPMTNTTPERIPVDQSMIFGLSMALAGSTVTNFQRFYTDLTVFLVGNLFFTIAFWASVVIWYREI